ncbi:MAG TPA: penicillin-binding protein activator [Polyangia bacterium]|nr:penicillin-binding protein activator [Polyangia bacterium]
MSLRVRKRLWSTAAALILLAGCPTRFDPRAEPIGSSPNAEADHAYREARARLEIGDLKDAEARFAGFLERYPNDPLAPSARLGEARAAIGLGEGKKARELLEPMTTAPTDEHDPLKVRARYLLGMALHRAGDWSGSRALLRPFENEIAADEAIELHAVLADDAAQLADVADALREYAIFFAGARPAEKLYVRDRVAALVAKLPPTEARAALERFPVEGRRAESGSSRAVTRSIGCVLPLSGKGRALGERGLRGALLAADLVSPSLPSGAPVELKLRDTGSDPARAARAVEELADEGVAAILGSPERNETESAAPKAEELGVPFLELAPDKARRGSLTFKLVRAREAGAGALAQMAVKSGARTVAVLAPDSAYGRAMAQAFVEAARSHGARVTADLRYAETATTFVEPAKKLLAAGADALFVPAPANQLQLIAPQLTSSGLLRMANIKTTGHMMQLYATADGINDKFLQSTAKYLQGAVLAPVFYADASNAQVAAFVEKYRQAYGEEPSSLDALAFDAVRAARIALEQGGATRAGVGAALAHLDEIGLTGEVGFTAAGDRAGTPPLYVVDGDGLRALK